MSRAWAAQQDDAIKKERTRPLGITEDTRERTLRRHPQEGLRILARIIVMEAAKQQQIKAKGLEERHSEEASRL